MNELLWATGLIVWLAVILITFYGATYPLFVTISVTMFRLWVSRRTRSGIVWRPFMRTIWITLVAAYKGEHFVGYTLRARDSGRVFVHRGIYKWEEIK